jgi:hypothetical protein
VEQQHPVVTSRFGARSLGSPRSSKPSMTWSRPMSGAYSFAGASRSSLPSSTSCSAAVPVMALVVEKMAKTVSAVIASGPSRRRTPAAPS